MPKTEIDYSNTIIYKITCKDSAVTDVYVGHTTNFIQRKHAHKQSCINIKSANHMCKVYEVIRANGGWNNWKMEIINFFDCKDHYEARKKEQEYFISLNANLNSIEPMPKPKYKEVKKEKEMFSCITCNMQVNNIEEHNKTKKHLKNLTVVGENKKQHSLFNCEKCEFSCSKKTNYDTHLSTRKHNSYIELQTKTDNNIKKNICICGKAYVHRQGLYTHKLTCKFKNDLFTEVTPNEDIKNLTNLVIEFIKNNTEFKKQLVDILKII